MRDHFQEFEISEMSLSSYLIAKSTGMDMIAIPVFPARRFMHMEHSIHTDAGIEHPSELPPQHFDWIAALPLAFDDGRRTFVHAGVDPARPLDRQSEHDLVWIREPFLSSARDYGRLIVHGHTPLTSGFPDVRPNRLNIDTAAVYGGPLTAAVFTDDATGPVAFLTDRGPMELC